MWRTRRRVPTAPRCTPRRSGASCWRGISRASAASDAARGSPAACLAAIGSLRPNPRSRCPLTGPGSRCRSPPRPSACSRRRTLGRLASFTIAPAETRSRRSRGRRTARRSRSAATAEWSRFGTSTAPRCSSARCSGWRRCPELAEAIQELAFSPNGQLLAASDKSQTTTLGHHARLAARDDGHVEGGHRRPGRAAGRPRRRQQPERLGRGRVLARRQAAGGDACSPAGFACSTPPPGSVLRTLTDPGDDGISLAFAPRGTLLAEGTVGRDRRDVGRAHRQAPRAAAARRYRGDHRRGVRPERTAVRHHRLRGRHDQAVVHRPACSRKARGSSSDPDATSTVAFLPDGGSARRRRSRRRVHVADFADRVGAARLLARRPEPHDERNGRELVGGPRYTSVCP